MKISLVIPAYNEEEAIKPFLEALVEHNYDKKYEVIIVDDGSIDKTPDIVNEYPVKLIKHNTNKGYGAALKTGIRKSTGDKVITMDSDGQHKVSDLAKIESLLDEYDMVLGERDRESHQVANRKFGKKVIRWVGEYLLEQKLPDYNSGFRAFDKKTIMKMLHILPNGFSLSTTSTLAFIKEGYTIGIVPINVTNRVGRKSTVKIGKDGIKTILLLFRIIMLFNPLKIFFPTSILFSLFGIAWGVYGYAIYGRFANTAILVSMFGLFLFFFGLIADLLATLNRKSNE